MMANLKGLGQNAEQAAAAVGKGIIVLSKFFCNGIIKFIPLRFQKHTNNNNK